MDIGFRVSAMGRDDACCNIRRLIDVHVCRNLVTYYGEITFNAVGDNIWRVYVNISNSILDVQLCELNCQRVMKILKKSFSFRFSTFVRDRLILHL